MPDVLMRLDLCVYHIFGKRDTTSIKQMQEVLDKDNVSSFVQFQSCCMSAFLQLECCVACSNLSKPFPSGLLCFVSYTFGKFSFSPFPLAGARARACSGDLISKVFMVRILNLRGHVKTFCTMNC